jgi:hypothetical protein
MPIPYALTLAVVARALTQAGMRVRLAMPGCCHAAADAVREDVDSAWARAVVARALAEAGQPGEASDALRAALMSAMRGGRRTVFRVIEDGAAALAIIAGQETLRQVAEAVLEVENWWARPKQAGG